MTTSNRISLPTKFTRIDETSLQDHWHLTNLDFIAYFGEYYAKAGFDYSDMNQLIMNLKKPMNRRGKAEWRYKEKAKLEFSKLLISALSEYDFSEFIFVPVPPSKLDNHPEFDNRLMEILNLVKEKNSINICDLVLQKENREQFHTQDEKRDAEELFSNFKLNEHAPRPAVKNIIIFDDLLTTGTTYRAMEKFLKIHFPDCDYSGMFLARRVPFNGDAIDIME